MAGLREISVDVVSRRGALALAGQVGALMALSACSIREEKSYKPVLYLYPEAITDVTVELSFDGRLTYTYPQPEQGADGAATWSVTAHPDGDLVDAAGRHYPSLFWEGNASKAFSQDRGVSSSRPARSRDSWRTSWLSWGSMIVRRLSSSRSGGRRSPSGARHW